MNKHNLLFLFTDEQRADTLAAYGNPTIQMPNLNKLASQSFIFENAYVTQPVCTPSRSSILTGLYPHTTGCLENNVPLKDDTACISEMLSNNEFYTGYHGKWHLGDEVFKQHNFQDWISIEDHYSEYYRENRDRNIHSSYHSFLVSNGFSPHKGNRFSREESARLPEHFGKPAFLAKEASRFITENKHNRFILYVNFLEPHMPFFSPRDNQHDPNEIILPRNFSDFPLSSHSLKAKYFQEGYYEYGHNGFDLRTEKDWRRLTANYWGLCSLVDTHIGTILNTLKDCDLYDNTIIVFTSDHGDMMGSHRLLAKCVMFEEAVKVPLLIHLPGQTKNVKLHKKYSQIDLLPTLLDLLDQKVPSHIQGQSLKPILNEGESKYSKNIFIEWNGCNTGFGKDLLNTVNLPPLKVQNINKDEAIQSVKDPTRTIITQDGWKFNCSTIDQHELFNLNTDPIETVNLDSQNAYSERMKILRDKVVAWQEKTKDEVVMSDI